MEDSPAQVLAHVDLLSVQPNHQPAKTPRPLPADNLSSVFQLLGRRFGTPGPGCDWERRPQAANPGAAILENPVLMGTVLR